MKNEVEIVEVDRLDGEQVIVYFSDDTMARYFVEELTGIKPDREQFNSGRRLAR